MVNLLAGSLLGAWAGASWATRMRSATLHKVLAALMVLMAAALVFTHLDGAGGISVYGPAQAVAGLVAGFGIGVAAAVMGVAGGELLIPTIVLLYGIDIKLAGSLSLAVSLPTMLVAFARYSRDQSFAVLRGNGWFVLAMTTGSIARHPAWRTLARRRPQPAADPRPRAAAPAVRCEALEPLATDASEGLPMAVRSPSVASRPAPSDRWLPLGSRQTTSCGRSPWLSHR